jgi:hypothetical protein
MIERTAKACGLKIEQIYWEPIGRAAEMCGPSGGWCVQTNAEYFLAYNARELCEQMRNWKEYDLALPDSHFAECEPVELEHLRQQAKTRDAALATEAEHG